MIDKQIILDEINKLPRLPDKQVKITTDFLKRFKNDVVFVFGDNNQRTGLGGQAAIARKVSNSYGFVTKKAPTHNPNDYYKPKEYFGKFASEIGKLKKQIEDNSSVYYLIPTLGNGLANKFNIWEHVIRDNIKVQLEDYENVIFLY
jgi:hypothetical protein